LQGASDWNTGWMQNVKTPFLTQTGKDFFFIPSVFSDPSTFGSASVMDGELNWNGGWPSGDSDATWSTDDRYLAALGSKAYMATVSPTFFTHYGANSCVKGVQQMVRCTGTDCESPPGR
jgi:glucan endo-1,3-alpha-glucosidase